MGMVVSEKLIMTKEQVKKLARELINVAKEDISIRVYEHDSDVSIFGSELAALRIYKRYHKTHEVSVGKCVDSDDDHYCIMILNNFVFGEDYEIGITMEDMKQEHEDSMKWILGK